MRVGRVSIQLLCIHENIMPDILWDWTCDSLHMYSPESHVTTRSWDLLRGNQGYLRSHSWGPDPRHHGSLMEQSSTICRQGTQLVILVAL